MLLFVISTLRSADGIIIVVYFILYFCNVCLYMYTKLCLAHLTILDIVTLHLLSCINFSYFNLFS